mgnify:CR=1 FL=1
MFVPGPGLDACSFSKVIYCFFESQSLQYFCNPMHKIYVVWNMKEQGAEENKGCRTKRE